MFRRKKFTFLNTKDDRIKVVNERINMTEKHLIEMGSSVATCTRKLAKYRDAYDELAKSLKNFADDEEVSETLSDGLKKFTKAVTILGDYMDLQVHRLEAKIFNELASYENICKSTRDNLRTAVITRDKEVLKQRQMLELKSKFNANNITADSELLKAKLDVNRSNKEIDDIINNFELRKLNDIKSILTDFVLISMKYHTKALEALTASYQDVSNIDERCDFMEFQKLMKSKDDAKERPVNKGSLSQRSQSMESLKRSSELSITKARNRLSHSTKNLAGLITDDHDDDDDDDDDDDEEDDDDDDDDDDEEVKEVDKNVTVSAVNSNIGEDDDSDDDDDTEDNIEKATAKSQQKEDQDSIKSKFKAKPRATYVFRRDLNQTPESKEDDVGIPSTTYKHATSSHNSTVQFQSDTSEEAAFGLATSSTAGLVTLVKSKKIKNRYKNHEAAAKVEEVIDCRSNRRT